MLNICVFTGTRAEYGILKPVISAINDHSEMNLSLIVTGMHLSKEFGYTINEIKKDGFTICASFEMNPKNDTGFSMALSIGEGIKGTAKALKTNKPDLLIILGDRIEALSACVASVFMNIPVVHFSGGDTTKGSIDESTRHAITKFAHIHFPATQESAERILKMGEDQWRIFPVGEPSLDTILNMKYITQNEYEAKFNVDLSKPLIIMIQHPVTTEPDQVIAQIKPTINAIKKLKFQTIIIYPNSDAGGREIIKEIEVLEDQPYIKIYKNLIRDDFLNTLKYASVMIGNSSSGITEAPSFKLPVINIGTRQEGRQRSTNIIDVQYNEEEIISAIKKALFDKNFKNLVNNCINPYGDGNSSKRVVEILTKLKFDNNLLKKQITY